MKKAKAKALTKAERAERRKRMAAAVAGGASASEAAKQFGASANTVYSACREYKVVILSTVHADTLTLIARLQNTDDTHEQIAADFGVTRQQVTALLNRCREAGIVFDRKKKKQG